MPRERKGSGKPTLADVAALAGVSAITVSRALRDPGAVSAELRERVARAVATIGYVPNTAASSLASARSDVIGVVIPSVTNVVFADVLRGIYDRVEDTGFQVQLGNTDYSMLKEERLIRLFAGQRPAAMLITGFGQSKEAARLLEHMGCPLVQIMELAERPTDMAIGFSHRDAARMATEHLISEGYRRIGFLGAQMDHRTRARIDGYGDAMHAAGLFDEKLIVTTLKPSSATIGGMLCAELLARSPDADAVQANNDDIALGALFEVQRRRLRVPQEFGVMGFNDVETMSAAYPSLTSVRTHRYEMGRQAIDMLLRAIGGERPEMVVDLGYELIVRESTARLAGTAAPLRGRRARHDAPI